MVTIGSLFAGIGGLELGVEWATGGTTIWQAENDPFARRVLAKHWPDATRINDVREIDETTPRPDIICGGFPCQDISIAGKQEGIGGAKSGLWSEYARIVGLLRPHLVYIENVAALASNGLHRVLADLASLGFDAEWDTLGACCVGAPHQRERVFILARNADSDGESALPVNDEAPGVPGMAADADNGRRQKQRRSRTTAPEYKAAERHRGWSVEPRVDRVVDGFPGRVDSLRCLGNAVVPQQAEAAFRILAARMT